MSPARTVIGFAIFAIVGCSKASEQQPTVSDTTASSGTRLERFLTKYGEVVVMGSEAVDGFRVGYGDSIVIEAREFQTPTDSARVYGLRVELRRPRAYVSDDVETAFIDFDEIVELVRAMDYVASVDASASRLGHLEARYRSRGDLVVGAYKTARDSGHFIRAGGPIGGVSAFPTSTQFARFKTALGSGRELLVQAGARDTVTTAAR